MKSKPKPRVTSKKSQRAVRTPPRPSSAAISKETRRSQPVKNQAGSVTRRSSRLHRNNAGLDSVIHTTSVAKSATVRYEQLDLGKRQIRILRLLPGEFHDTIQASLVTVHLDDKPQYEALSYVWGDPQVCMPIRVDGEERLVTTNLWAALRRCTSSSALEVRQTVRSLTTASVRSLDKERQLWVDALCINQDDNDEKNHQVVLMSEIYSNTERCVAWLGDFDEDAVREPSAAPRVATSPWRERQGNKKKSRSSSSQNVKIARADAERAFSLISKLSKKSQDGHFTTEEGDPPDGWVKLVKSEIDSLEVLTELDWWKRIWTVQEAILPPRLVLVCGTLELEEEIAMWGVSSSGIFGAHGPQFRCCVTIVPAIPYAWGVLMAFDNSLRGTRSWKQSMSLGHAIQHFRQRRCEDPRDKVFALLGLFNGITRQLVDYSLTKREAYIRIMRHSIFSFGSLSPLLRPWEASRDSSLPSWVPDLVAPLDRRRKGRSPYHDTNFDFLYRAAGERSMDLEVGEEDKLFVKGVKFDKIKAAAGYATFVREDESYASFFELIAAWRGLMEKDTDLDFRKYPSGGSYSNAFWRTCTNDAISKTGGRPQRIAASDEEWIKRLRISMYGHGITDRNEFFITENGFIGVGPAETKVGDMVTVLFGGAMPFILREIDAGERGGCYTYVGHSYVHGIMDGEAVEGSDAVETFTIV